MKVNVNPRDLDKFCIKYDVKVFYIPSENYYVLKKNGVELEVEVQQEGFTILDMDRPNFIAEILKISVYEP